ncbi:MAG: glutamate--cysteine ligase [Gammaproteobacteria bacterium]|nr:glutamate--cysteine ligase [Gammaproteobacteria bacterium]NNF67372.1 glutamate--cysteine ligase [Gammaproteobacteria bacterium]
MGMLIDRDHFDENEFSHFDERLKKNLLALKKLLQRDDFGIGEPSLGAELEMDLVDDAGRPLNINRSVLSEHLDPRLQLELTRFNLELNLSPVKAAGKPFTAMQNEMQQALQALEQEVKKQHGQIVTIGILPTLQISDLQRSAMTDLPRYRALSNGLRRISRSPFRIKIDGDEPVDEKCDDVTLEGANTSFQFHLRINPSQFADTFNAAQLVTPLATAISANSPIFLQHCLWEETRVALFKQAVDARSVDSDEWRRAARVPFGHGWVRHSAFEQFAEAVYLYPSIIPVCDEEDPVEVVNSGKIPRLSELRLQQGTVWQWNRPVYDPADGGHLRIELRSLPSGPTPIDMFANAAFLTGLCIGMRDRIGELLPAFPFRYADYNFYRASQAGLGARLLWPQCDSVSPVEHSASDLIVQNLSLARDGLSELGIDATEAAHFLDIIEARAVSGKTAARWQRETLQKLDRHLSRTDALREMLSLYKKNSDTGMPVSTWPDA